jgi:hypothetical protein
MIWYFAHGLSDHHIPDLRACNQSSEIEEFLGWWKVDGIRGVVQLFRQILGDLRSKRNSDISLLSKLDRYFPLV